MGLFSKTEIIEAVLPFRLAMPIPMDEEECLIDIEAYGRIGEYTIKYYYAAVFCNIPYDEFVEMLTNLSDKKIKIIAKVKNDTIKKFDIDFKDLSKKLQDERVKKAHISAYNITDKSVFENQNYRFIQ